VTFSYLCIASILCLQFVYTKRYITNSTDIEYERKVVHNLEIGAYVLAVSLSYIWSLCISGKSILYLELMY
jgi:hypothetical protein